MRETNVYHLLTQHQVITFLVCAVALTIIALVIAVKLMNRLENNASESARSERDKKDLK
jgi:multisubunit Na+/H+ antiporter MnhC subunit